MPKGRGKFFITLGGVTVLVAGVFIGAFLVLRSEASEGKLYTISNPAAKSTQELLNELYQLKGEAELEKQKSQNLTEDFLTTVSREGEQLGLNPSDYGSDEFLYGTVLPYLYSSQDELFLPIPTGRILVDESLNRRAYGRSLKPFFDTFEDIFGWLGEAPKNYQDPFDPELIQEASLRVSLLSTNFEKILVLPVPPGEVEFHKQVLQLSLAIQKTLESYVNTNTDPLRMLVDINQFEEVVLFAEQLFNKFSRL